MIRVIYAPTGKKSPFSSAQLAWLVRDDLTL